MGAAYGKQAPVAWLISILSQFQEALPVQGKMTSMQLHLLAANIARDFYYLKASEIMLFLSRIAGGRYGIQWYGQIQPDIIFSTLQTRFMTERDNELRMAEITQKDSTPPSQPITWEEHCRRHGKPVTPNPLKSLHNDTNEKP